MKKEISVDFSLYDERNLFFKVLVALLRITQLEIIQRMPKNKPAYYNVTQFLRYVIPANSNRFIKT